MFILLPRHSLSSWSLPRMVSLSIKSRDRKWGWAEERHHDVGVWKMLRPDSFPRRKSPFLLLNLGETLVPLSLRAWRKKQQSSVEPHYSPGLSWIQSIGGTKVTQGQKGREVSSIHKQNSTYSLDLNVNMAGSKLMIKTCTVE